MHAPLCLCFFPSFDEGKIFFSFNGCAGAGIGSSLKFIGCKRRFCRKCKRVNESERVVSTLLKSCSQWDENGKGLWELPLSHDDVNACIIFARLFEWIFLRNSFLEFELYS